MEISQHLDAHRYPPRKRRLNDQEQADQVEGVLGNWPICTRCELRMRPWRNANGNVTIRHYVCPDEPRRMKWFPPRDSAYSQGEYSTKRRPSYVGVMGGMRMAEIYQTTTGKFSYVYRLSFDGCVRMTWCKKFFPDRPSALRHATDIVTKGALWDPPALVSFGVAVDIDPEDLKALENGRKELEAYLAEG